MVYVCVGAPAESDGADKPHRRSGTGMHTRRLARYEAHARNIQRYPLYCSTRLLIFGSLPRDLHSPGTVQLHTPGTLEICTRSPCIHRAHSRSALGVVAHHFMPSGRPCSSGSVPSSPNPRNRHPPATDDHRGLGENCTGRCPLPAMATWPAQAHALFPQQASGLHMQRPRSHT